MDALIKQVLAYEMDHFLNDWLINLLIAIPLVTRESKTISTINALYENDIDTENQHDNKKQK